MTMFSPIMKTEIVQMFHGNNESDYSIDQNYFDTKQILI